MPESRAREYGIVLREDVGEHYLGQLVEVGNMGCVRGDCGRAERELLVRMNSKGTWEARPRKPGGDHAMTDIVVPIIPDESWTMATVGKPGYLDYHDYRRGYSSALASCARLARDEKQLLQDLSKAAKRAKVFVP